MGVKQAEPNQVIRSGGLLEECARVIHNHAHRRRAVRSLGVDSLAEGVDLGINFDTVHLASTVTKSRGRIVAGAGADNQYAARIRFEAEGDIIVVAIQWLLGEQFRVRRHETV